MGFGYMGKILWVDLTAGTLEEEHIPDSMYERFLSGYGLAAKIIFDRQPAGVDPLGPENILGVMSGLLGGTGASFSGRWMLVGKSPLTGGWGDSNCGGNFAPAIKRAGYDGIFFVGKSDHPVYLLVEGDKLELIDATDLWGSDAFVTEDTLKERHGKKARVASIGQGGEKLSLMAGVVNASGRVAARSGLGAVMGSKNLKALCLAGNKKVRVADRKKMVDLSRGFNARLKRDKVVDKLFTSKLTSVLGRVLRRSSTQPAMTGELVKYTFRIWGTSGIAAMSAETGDSPVKNWSGVGFRDFPIGEKSWKISDDEVIRHETKKYGCNACPLSCGGTCTIKAGRYPIDETHKVEYETICAFGTLLLVDDLEVIFKINELLNRAGIDTISCGVTVAFAFEAYERGMLTKDDTGGLELTWGNGDAALALVERIIAAEGIGKLLKDGVKRASEQLGNGSEEFAMHVGGQEIPMHDARFDPGYGLHYEVEPTPGRHTIGAYQWTDVQALHRKTKQIPPPKPVHTYEDRFVAKGQGRVQAVSSRYADVINGCGLCFFGVVVGGDPPLAEWINAATGWRHTFDVYLETGRRIKTLRHAFNLREGITPEHTKMPGRARGIPPQDEGPLAGVSPDFEGLTHEYYRAMGWDSKTGQPHRHTLTQLDLPEVAEALETPTIPRSRS